jgi:hypothetical protein
MAHDAQAQPHAHPFLSKAQQLQVACVVGEVAGGGGVFREGGFVHVSSCTCRGLQVADMQT